MVNIEMIITNEFEIYKHICKEITFALRLIFIFFDFYAIRIKVTHLCLRLIKHLWHGIVLTWQLGIYYACFLFTIKHSLMLNIEISCLFYGTYFEQQRFTLTQHLITMSSEGQLFVTDET